jgi:hypothetical protein
VLLSLRVAVLPAGLAVLVLPRHNRAEMMRIYVMMNFIQESLDVVFFMPVYLSVFIIYAADESFGINSIIKAGSLYVTFFEMIRVIVINLLLVVKATR